MRIPGISSIQTKFLASALTLVLIMGAGTFLFLQAVLKSKILDEVQKRGILLTKNIADRSANLILTKRFTELQLTMLEQKRFSDDIEYIFITNENNDVLVHTFKNGFPVELKNANPSLRGIKYHITKLITERGEILDIMVPVLNGDLGFVHAGISKDPINTSVSRVMRVFEGIILLVLLAGCAMAIILSKIIIRPLKEFTITAKAIGEGDLERKVNITSNDELGRLGATFNKMVEDLKKTTVSRDYVSNVIKSMMNSLIVTDAEGEIEIVNDAALNLLGYTQNELTGMPVSAVFDKNPVELSAGGYVHGVESAYRAKDGKIIPVLLSMSVMRGVHSVIYVAQDNTLRKKAEEEKEKINAQIVKTERMYAIGRLAGGIAHDFNNLLTAIQGYAEFALMRVPSTDRLHDDIKEIQSAALRAFSLTRQLLLFSRQQPVEIKPVDLNVIIRGTENMLGRIIGENVKIITELAPSLFAVNTDENGIVQVIVNLGTNAKDAMPNGGTITIKTENVFINLNETAAMPGSCPGNFVCVSIADTGTGMDTETIKHIFEPFFTTKDVGKGTGLGLSVVYGIMQKSNGWIDVHSIPGQGTVFKLYFPSHMQKTESSDDGMPELPDSMRGSGEHILLVEDEKPVRDFASKILKEYGYEISIACDKKDALRILSEEKKDFRVVFTDSVLPDGSGIEVAESTLAIFPGVHVIITSGYIGDKSQWEDLKKKKYRFIQKPYTIVSLLKTMKELLY